MTAADAKKIPISAILGAPAKHGPRPGEAWYFSPFRVEKTPSFHVDLSKNIWYDHGAGRGGTIIDLVCALNDCSVADALKIIESAAAGGPENAPGSLSFSPAASAGDPAEAEEPGGITIEKIKALENRALLEYLSDRRIFSPAARSYLREAYYRIANRRYFSLAFANDAGGWELRNKYMKGNAGGKRISTIPGKDPAARSRDVAIFEGFFDFLSLVEMKKTRPRGTVIVLNSLSLLDAAINEIEAAGFRRVSLFFDRDPAGREATARAISRLSSPGRKVSDFAGIYAGYNDLNEWWIHAKKR